MNTRKKNLSVIEMSNAENELVVVEIFLKCSRNNGSACEKMRDELVKVKGITEAYITIDSTIDNVEYCVGGTAVSPKKDIRKLYYKIRNLKSNGDNPITVRKAEVLVPV